MGPFVLALVLLAAPWAQVRADTGAHDAVIELTQLIMSKEMYANMIGQMTTQLSQTMQQSGAPLPSDGAAQLKIVIEEVLPYKDVLDWNAEIYGRRFTLDEIRALTAFYRTPVGQKLARLLPDISGEVAKKSGAVIMERLPTVMKKHGLMK